MEQYLKSRRSTILHKNEGKDIDIAIENERQKNLFGNISENFKQDNKNDLIIPPLNTDIRFSEILPTHKPTYDERHGLFMSHPVIGQTDEHDHDTDSDSDDEDEQQFMMRTARRNLKEHPQTLHEHEDILENFTWGGSSEHDTSDDKMKKTLISKVRAQHACGSCWAVSIADCMSDCLVVSGTVNWSPNISETYLMAKIPQKNIHSLCFGGNPAGAVRYLEKNFIADSSCVDYSWCSGDDQNCTSVSSSKHFDVKQLTEILNANIPIPNGCYFSDKKKYMYKLNPGSDMFYKKDRMPLEKFRNTVKSHIVDFGPTIGGFVVLANFSTGNFTDPNINGGIYFDRADYNGYSGSGPLRFSDEMTSDVSGLHAVCIVGWGIKNNIQFDNDKFGDVPYWHCRNSWGTNWGNEGGYFKIAMYPFNKISQFDKQVMTEMGGPVGSMILIRATEPPKAIDASEIPKTFQNKINRQLSNEYYMASPERVRQINGSTGKFPLVAFGNGTYEQTRVLMLLVFILVLILLYEKINMNTFTGFESNVLKFGEPKTMNELKFGAPKIEIKPVETKSGIAFTGIPTTYGVKIPDVRLGKPIGLFPTIQKEEEEKTDANRLRAFKTVNGNDMNKIIALASGEFYLKNGFLSNRGKLNPEFDEKDITKISQSCPISFVDQNVMLNMSSISKLHVLFLRELYRETITTVEQAWEFVSQMSLNMGLSEIHSCIQYARNFSEDLENGVTRDDIQDENISYVLALYIFLLNDDKPKNVVAACKKFSPKIHKLGIDMCMASYGLAWLFDSNLIEMNKYINFHKNTYALTY